MIRIVLIFILSLISLLSFGQATTISWTGGAADNLWSSPANWDLGRVPGSDPMAEDSVVIDAAFIMPLFSVINIDNGVSLYEIRALNIIVTSGFFPAVLIDLNSNVTLSIRNNVNESVGFFPYYKW